MNEHLFKLKKDGKTVGYLQLKGGVPLPKTAAEKPLTAIVGLVWYNAEQTVMALQDIEIQWDTAHPFVTKDKNGKDVFADDPVWFHWKGKKTKGEIIKEGLFWKYKSHEGYSRTLCKFDISHIELIEDEANE